MKSIYQSADAVEMVIEYTVWRDQFQHFFVQRGRKERGLGLGWRRRSAGRGRSLTQRRQGAKRAILLFVGYNYVIITTGDYPRAIAMQTTKYVYWQEDNVWLGYLQDYPDYWTQGKTLEDLIEHLRDLYGDLNSGQIPGVRKVGELIVS